jgi:hypothetical protein
MMNRLGDGEIGVEDKERALGGRKRCILEDGNMLGNGSPREGQLGREHLFEDNQTI